jgi:hypothetical protein
MGKISHKNVRERGVLSPQHNERLALILFVWMQFWLAIPWLAVELPLPGGLGHAWVWDKVWAALVMPAVVTLALLAVEQAGIGRIGGYIVGMLGVLADGVYLYHHVPPPLRWAQVERWVAAALALSAVARITRTSHINGAAAVGIVAAASLVSAFAVQAVWAFLLAGSALALSWLPALRGSAGSRV